MLDPHSEAHGKDGPLGKSVFEMLQEKHPHSVLLIPALFWIAMNYPLILDCNELPLDVSVAVLVQAEQIPRNG